MKNSKSTFFFFFFSLTLIVSIRPALAANQYSVNPGANFRWDATKYYFMKNGLGIGNDLSYTHHYFLEFNFTNWAGLSGAEYLNGTVNNNGTINDGELSFASYWFGASSGGYWITEILDDVDIYLICNTEIDQSTIPSAQSYAAISWLTFTEVSHYNFTLAGTYIEGDETDHYTGNIRFNSDKVLSYIFDEMVAINNTIDVTMYIERYTWTLSYTSGTPPTPNGGGIPGFSIISIIAAITLGIYIVMKKKFRE
ncbi:MAG: Loki-CTERM sorting domain-containing protein [Promethearchaeota archaeon]